MAAICRGSVVPSPNNVYLYWLEISVCTLFAYYVLIAEEVVQGILRYLFLRIVTNESVSPPFFVVFLDIFEIS